MRVRITRTTFADGRMVAIGEVLEFPDRDAEKLVHMGKAVVVVDDPVASGAAAPRPEHGDPSPKRSRTRGGSG